MVEKRQKIILDSKQGNITGEYSNDKVMLIGTYSSSDINYIEKIDLVLDREESIPITINFPYTGYDMQLFVGDFTGDNKSEIMVRGAFGGSGGFEIAVIYKYDNGKLIEIFNQDEFYENNKCTAKYKDNYKVSVNCEKSKYLIDISNRDKDYLDYIYTPDKKVNTESAPYVDAPRGVYPLKQVYNDYYQILIHQRVVGQVNVDTLAIIQTTVELLDSKSRTVEKGILFSEYFLVMN